MSTRLSPKQVTALAWIAEGPDTVRCARARYGAATMRTLVNAGFVRVERRMGCPFYVLGFKRYTIGGAA